MSISQINALQKMVDELFDEAQKEIETKGAREEQGYDSIYRLKDAMSRMNLPWTERTPVLRYFYSRMDSLDYRKAKRVS